MSAKGTIRRITTLFSRRIYHRLPGFSAYSVLRGKNKHAGFQFWILLVLMVFAGTIFFAGRNRPERQPVSSPSDAKPLAVQLIVKDDAGVNRKSEPVTSGIPIPKSHNVTSTADLSITRSDGVTSVPAQFTALARWNGPVTDTTKPIQWVLVDFQADVPANGSSSYFLKSNPDRPNVDSPNAIKLSEDAGAITVDTGPMEFKISKLAFNLFDGVWLDLDNNRTFDANEAIVSPGNPDGGLLTDTFKVEYSTRLGTRSVVVEEAGPLRTVIRVEGRHKASPGTGLSIGFYDYLVRIHAFAGKSFVKVHYTVKNSPPARDGTPFFDSLAFDDYSLRTTLNLGQPRTYKLFGEKEYQGQDDIYLYQDSSGGPNWMRNHENLPYDYMVQHDNNPLKNIEGGYTFRGFKIVKGDTKVDAGNQAAGWVDLSDAKWGLTAQIRHFWQQCPKATEVIGNKVILRLWPKYYNGIHWIDDGVHKTHEILYAFHRKDIDVEAAVKSFNTPLLATAPAEWYNHARVIGPFGDLYVPDSSEIPDSSPLNRSGVGDKSALYAARDPENLYGWTGFGDTKSNPSGAGCPCIDPSTFGPYLQTFKRDLFDTAEEFARQWMDVRQFHRDSTEIEEFDGPMPDKSAYTAGTHQQAWWAPDLFHAWYSLLYEYYLLTGNRKSLEAAIEIIKPAREYAFLFIDTGEVFPVERGYGWIVYELTRMYEITGNISYLDDAEQILKYARLQVEPMRGNMLAPDFYGVDVLKDQCGRDDCAEKVWMMGIGLLGLSKYANVVMDNNIPRRLFDAEDARDMAIAAADLIVDEAYLPCDGTLQFEDHWYLFSPPPSQKVRYPFGCLSIEFPIISGLSGLYKITGKESYHSASRARALDKFDPHNYTAYANDSRIDRIPPAAITDLSVERGSQPRQIVLTWTAPGDDGDAGQAFRYQVKYSEKPLVEHRVCKTRDCYSVGRVENVRGNPGSAVPYYLPVESRINWTNWWAATNVKTEPDPMPAGTRQQMIIDNLDPGKTFYFAIKSEDKAHNISAISNVVSYRVGM